MNNIILTKWCIALNINIGVLETRLAICQSGTLVTLSSKVDGPVAHGSTWLIWLMEAFNYPNADISSVSFVHF